jgi:hypothetical protein
MGGKATSRSRALRVAMNACMGSPEEGVDLVKTDCDIGVRKPQLRA